ncbi:MAG: Lrp/AsnC family transcriptional regulator [Xanthomonadales bacterium]|nr:Lrp/AsnC family transcriptional regulator [Xanthomonadales bacterium]
MQLDRTDFEILRQLRKNARLPNKALAERLGIAPSTALERVRRLHEAGAILGYHAEIRPSAIGIGLQALVSVRLARHSRTDVAAFNTYLGGLREVLAFYHIAGADDFLIHVAVQGSDHLRDLVLDAFTTRPEVARIETSLIFSFQRNPELPVYAE